jgi:hypothetical protein
MTELYRSPSDTLRREVEHLKARLKQERAEVAGLEAKLMVEKSAGLALLIDICRKDVDATEGLVVSYRKAIRKLEKR